MNSNNKILFTVTEKMLNISIKEFILKDNDFEITWSNERKFCMSLIQKKNQLKN